MGVIKLWEYIVYEKNNILFWWIFEYKITSKKFKSQKDTFYFSAWSVVYQRYWVNTYLKIIKMWSSERLALKDFFLPIRLYIVFKIISSLVLRSFWEILVIEIFDFSKKILSHIHDPFTHIFSKHISIRIDTERALNILCIPKTEFCYLWFSLRYSCKNSISWSNNFFVISEYFLVFRKCLSQYIIEKISSCTWTSI